VTVVVHGTGVAVRLATQDEVLAVAAARHGREFALTPSRSFTFTEPEQPSADDDAPRRIELDSGLVGRLVPLRRG
jgi:hypothetical protein